ncbi:MAG TPA: 4'-phosphopantetheinyl transferase superfamily protein, partial [Chthoniobacterales bacterium]|nr:4'-phosphopantetheinyl transferase superfamily protein [Chthoniobacterales bacterium]
MGGDSATAVREGRREREKQLLKAVLGERLNSDPKGLKIEIAAGGKPFVNGCKFSISHSGAWLIVAVSDREIGVDIETRKALKDPMALATRFFSPADADYLKSAREDLREKFFLRQWVAKEAALKCAGTGISEHLHRAECGYEQSAITTVGCAADRFAIHEFMLPDETPGAVAWHDDGTLVG